MKNELDLRLIPFDLLIENFRFHAECMQKYAEEIKKRKNGQQTKNNTHVHKVFKEMLDKFDTMPVHVKIVGDLYPNDLLKLWGMDNDIEERNQPEVS